MKNIGKEGDTYTKSEVDEMFRELVAYVSNFDVWHDGTVHWHPHTPVTHEDIRRRLP